MAMSKCCRDGERAQSFSCAPGVEVGLQFRDQLSIGLLLHVAWSCVSLCAEVPDALMFDIRARMEEGAVLDEDHLNFLGAVVLQRVSQQRESTSGDELLDSWLRELSHDLCSGVAARRTRSAVEPSLWERWLSSGLLELRVPHESPCLVLGVHRVAAALVEKKLVLEILGPMDLATPSQRLLHSAAVRQRQLEALGWARRVIFQADAERVQREEGSLVGMLDAHDLTGGADGRVQGTMR